MERGSKRYAELWELIPEEILFEILTRLPVKSLLKFRCFCKSWKLLISSPNFKNAHLERQVMNSSSDGVLIRAPSTPSLYTAKISTKCMNLDLTRRCEMNFSTSDIWIYGSCNGLLCICHKNKLYIWNPSIRKRKRLRQGLYRNKRNLIGIGFGFHHQENDYKVVRIDQQAKNKFIVEVYSFRLNAWRSFDAVLPISLDSASIKPCGVHVKGVVYWMVVNWAENSAKSSILCFDMYNEVFRSMELPDTLASGSVDIRVFEKSLSFLQLRQGDQLAGNVACCDIWVLEQDTWKMTRTILLPQASRRYSLHNEHYSPASPAWILSITKHGVYIGSPDQIRDFRPLFLYDPISREAKEITRVKPFCHIRVDTYIENLVLLD